MGAASPKTFTSTAAFRTWLERHHSTTTELVVRLFKTHAAKRGLTYAQALDEALCFGWIDGVRRAVDEDSFSVRFTPRKPKSIWSAVNIRHATRLEAEGRMRQAGLAAFRAREESRSRVYSFESKPEALPPAYARRLKANARAWRDFQARPPWYRRTSTFWILSAKKPETRDRRFAVLLACSARREAIPALRRTKS
jgi:uncharacterized protein YdeI (YjbR/CyaY-like superfamily)